jgi:hypothetical protein
VDNARATATRAPAQTAAPIVLTGFIKLLLPKAIMNFHTNLALVMLTRSPFWRPGRLKLYTQLRSFSQDFLFGSWIRHTISQTPKSWSSEVQFFLRETSFASAKRQFCPAGKTENREAASFQSLP